MELSSPSESRRLVSRRGLFVCPTCAPQRLFFRKKSERVQASRMRKIPRVWVGALHGVGTALLEITSHFGLQIMSLITIVFVVLLAEHDGKLLHAYSAVPEHLQLTCTGGISFASVLSVSSTSLPPPANTPRKQLKPVSRDTLHQACPGVLTLAQPSHRLSFAPRHGVLVQKPGRALERYARKRTLLGRRPGTQR